MQAQYAQAAYHNSLIQAYQNQTLNNPYGIYNNQQLHLTQAQTQAAHNTSNTANSSSNDILQNIRTNNYSNSYDAMHDNTKKIPGSNSLNYKSNENYMGITSNGIRSDNNDEI